MVFRSGENRSGEIGRSGENRSGEIGRSGENRSGEIGRSGENPPDHSEDDAHDENSYQQTDHLRHLE